MIWHSNGRMHIGSQHPVEGLAQCDYFHIGDGRDRLRDAIQRRIDRQPSRIILIITTRLADNGFRSTHVSRRQSPDRPPDFSSN